MTIVFSSITLFVHKICFHFASWFTMKFLLFDIKMVLEITKEEIGSSKQLAMANYNIYFKNNFGRLILNITHKFSLLTKCAYMMLN